MAAPLVNSLLPPPSTPCAPDQKDTYTTSNGLESVFKKATDKKAEETLLALDLDENLIYRDSVFIHSPRGKQRLVSWINRVWDEDPDKLRKRLDLEKESTLKEALIVMGLSLADAHNKYLQAPVNHRLMKRGRPVGTCRPGKSEAVPE